MDIKDENEREQWREAFAKEQQELVPVLERIIELAKPRGNQESCFEDMEIIIKRSGTFLTLDRFRRILNNWYESQHYRQNLSDSDGTSN